VRGGKGGEGEEGINDSMINQNVGRKQGRFNCQMIFPCQETDVIKYSEGRYKFVREDRERYERVVKEGWKRMWEKKSIPILSILPS